MTSKSPVHTNWVEELAFEVALEYFAPEDLQLKFGLTPEAYDKITSAPAFRKATANYRREIDDDGIAFKLRARKHAENILDELHAMAFDARVNAKERLTAMEMLCRYAGFDMKTQQEADGVKVQIFTNLSLNDRNPQGSYTIEIPADAPPALEH